LHRRQDRDRRARRVGHRAVESPVTDILLADRIARLERVARRDRVLALGALALALATAQAPAPRAQPPLTVRDAAGNTATLSSSGLSVRDPSHTVRIDTGLDASGYPSVDLYDASGTIRQAMYLLKDRPVLRQFDKDGKRRAEMFVASDTENGEFVLRDATDTPRLAAFLGTKGLPELALYGSDAKVRAYISADDSGPYLVMKDAQAVSRLVAGQYTSGKMGMDVRDTSGTAVWTKP
ncbi:MAG: hypothetical protein ABI316_00265, partial [Casimicrobiaceae bacterium]